MNKPSPFTSQSSTPEPKNSNRTRVRIAVFCILSVHVIGLVALLMNAGCRRQETENIPAPDTNNVSVDATNLDAPTNVVDTTLPTNPPPTMEPTNPVVQQPTPPPPQPVPPAAGQEYTIVKGDTFATIAKKFPGVSAKHIQEANPTVQPTKLKIGQKIQIPAGSASAPVNTATSAPDNNSVAGGDNSYTVKSGDTLTTIAKSHGTSVKAIRSANSLTTDKIRVGQKLKLPARSSAPAPAEPMPTPAPAPMVNPSTTPTHP